MLLVKNKEKEQAEMHFSGTVAELLAHIGVNSETVIVSINGVVAGDDAPIVDTDTVTIYSVISGG